MGLGENSKGGNATVSGTKFGGKKDVLKLYVKNRF